MTANDCEADQRWMSRALRLAVLGREAAPNPMVGCVLLNAAGRKIGEGYHNRVGEPHAEINALRAASESPQGGTAYVSLEPCSHHGRTPPCAEALVLAGVARVVVAMLDPDSRVCGTGVALLRAEGIAVDVGVLEPEARAINAAYIKHRTTGEPYITVKMAMTLDGKIATASGDSKWITSPVTRLWVHRQLRARSQAIMVGVGTVIADDPSLTVRLHSRPMARNPLRVIVDTHLRTPLDSRVVSLAKTDANTLIAYSDDPMTLADEFTARGVRLLPCGSDRGGVDLGELISRLGHELDVTSVLVEGGSELVASLLSLRLVDCYYAAIAPKIVGGRRAPGPVGGDGLSALVGSALTGTGLRTRRSGPDVVLSCRLNGGV